MPFTFPSAEWLEAAADALNQDSRYAQVARAWEGDCLFEVELEDQAAAWLYFDLWHGACRRAHVIESGPERPADPTFIIGATQRDFLRVLQGELDPIQAMLTRRLKVRGSMGYMLRNIPTVLDFVRVVSGVPLDRGERGEAR